VKKRALGKGLGALIPDGDISEQILESDQILQVSIDDIKISQEKHSMKAS